MRALSLIQRIEREIVLERGRLEEILEEVGVNDAAAVQEAHHARQRRGRRGRPQVALSVLHACVTAQSSQPPPPFVHRLKSRACVGRIRSGVLWWGKVPSRSGSAKAVPVQFFFFRAGPNRTAKSCSTWFLNRPI